MMEQIGFIICEIALLISAVIFVHEKKRQGYFKLRFGISTVVMGVLILCLSGIVTFEQDILNIAIQIGTAILMMVYVGVNWDISISIAVYNTLWARLFWWIWVELLQGILVIQTHFQGKLRLWLVVAEIIGFLAICLFLMTITVARWIPEDRRKIGPRQLLSAILIAIIFESLSFLLGLGKINVTVDRWMILFLLQLICIFIMYLQNELFRKSAMRQELNLVHLLLQKEQEQYRLSKENIAIINQKCHDLKHQIRAIRQSEDGDKSRYLQEVEDSIGIYEAIVQTGNEVLDTILTEKSLYCKEKGITVSCVADGQLLSFMQTMDLYSLFGNALDNAIEAVEKLPEEVMRQIDVLIYKQQRFLVIHIINPVGEQLTFEDGLPVTTKSNKNFHGFGMRSMQYIVKKYDGFLTASQEDGCFSLKILIPILDE